MRVCGYTLKKYLGGALQRKTFILTAALLGALNAAAADTPAPTPAPTPVAKAEAAKPSDVSKTADVHHKSPVVAGALAFFPGMLIHGTGHMYAGSWIKGLGLLAIEGAGVGVAAYQISTGITDIQNMTNSNNGSIPTDLSPAYSRIGVILVGTVAFFFTWFDDMSGAPIAAMEYNKRADQAASRAELHLLPVNGGARLVYSAKF
jgi:TM2 domain-containing membrane protein YozV